MVISRTIASFGLLQTQFKSTYDKTKAGMINRKNSACVSINSTQKTNIKQVYSGWIMKRAFGQIFGRFFLIRWKAVVRIGKIPFFHKHLQDVIVASDDAIWQSFSSSGNVDFMKISRKLENWRICKIHQLKLKHITLKCTWIWRIESSI